MSALPGELQLWSGASVPLPARLPAFRSASGVRCGDPAQSRHSDPGSVSGRPGSLPTAHPPFTGTPSTSVGFDIECQMVCV